MRIQSAYKQWSRELDKIEDAKREAEANTIPYVPAYMVIALHPISKMQYDEMSKQKNVTAKRALGFVVENKNNDTRLVFITEGGKYYQGKLDPDHTTEMFMTRETHGVETHTQIVFTKSAEHDK